MIAHKKGECDAKLSTPSRLFAPIVSVGECSGLADGSFCSVNLSWGGNRVGFISGQ
jgi:hypothetical protein